MGQWQDASGCTERFERKREAILDAATRILNRRGIKGLTLGDTAAAVGLSTTSVTYYFRRKDDLAAASISRGILRLLAIAVAAGQAATPQARLTAFVGGYLGVLAAAARGEAEPMPIISELRALGSPQRETVLQTYSRLFQATRQLFDHPDLAWMSRGRRSARARMLLEQSFWGGSWLSQRSADEMAELRAGLADILINGLAQPGVVWAPCAMRMNRLAEREGPELSRETFLLAATRLINQRGYRGASVDKISAELNVTKGSFYHHNDAKDDLVVACFTRSFEVTRRAQRLASEGAGDAWSHLTTGAAALAEFQLSDHGPLLRTMAVAALPEAMRGAVVEQSERITETFAAGISEGIREGTIRPVDPVLAAHLLSATLNACADLGGLEREVRAKAAAGVFVRPLLMGVFAQ